MTKAISKRQKDASANLFKINPVFDKRLGLLPNGLLTLIPDDTEFTNELGDKIIEMVRDGETVLEIIEKADVALTSIFKWRDITHPDYKKEFAEEYAVAYEESADILEWKALQKAIDKSGDLYPDPNKDGSDTMRPNSANVQRSRLQVESLDKITESRNPEKYASSVEPEYGSHKNMKSPIIIVKDVYWEDQSDAKKNSYGE